MVEFPGGAALSQDDRDTTTIYDIYKRIERRVFILRVTGAFTQIVDIRSPAIIEHSSDRDIRVPDTVTVFVTRRFVVILL